MRELPPTAGLPPRGRDLLRRGEPALEQALAAFIGVPETILCSSGSACLVVALECLKLRSDARTVIVPGYTCPLVALACFQAGCRVVACDRTPDGLDLDLSHLERLLGSDTLCVLPTHYGGALTDIAAVRGCVAALAPHVVIIEDAAQAFGARRDGLAVGTQGDIGFFSFATGKGLTLIEGGCLIARDEDMRRDLRRIATALAAPSLAYEAWHSLQLACYHALYTPPGLTLAYGVPRRWHLGRGRPEAAIGDRSTGTIPLRPVSRFRQRIATAGLARLPSHLEQCAQRFGRLVEDLQTRAPALLPVTAPGKPVHSFLLVRAPDATTHDLILAEAWRSQLGLSKLFMRALGDYPTLHGRLQPSDTPNARHFAATAFTLTTSPFMRDEEQERLLDRLARISGQSLRSG